ncbi:hypothetical protein IMAU20013_02978 [Lactiplantibacillus plantarum]|nr:hypothetical protein [Lactiplantibacillus plantarum]MCG0882534.1 hypothetical protein [Lactiplantibacillus plantarum]
MKIVKSDLNSFVKSSISIVSSNFLLLISGILNGIILPKIMGVNQYGYYKIFSLYAGYIALLHFGFVDGILLKYGGVDQNKLDIKMVRSITRFFIFLQIILSIIAFLLSTLFFKKGYLNMLSIFISIYNIQMYFQYFSQATMHFQLISKLNVLQSLLISTIIIVNYFLFLNNKIHKLYAMQYIILYEIVFVIILIVFLKIYNEFWVGKTYSFYKIVGEIRELFILGIPVMLSSQIASLILNLDNQIISIFFNPHVFGIYSFAYSLMMVVTTIVSALSVVIFPFLNRKSLQEIMMKYNINLGYLLLFIYGSLIVYYPAKIFIGWYLPNYSSSLVYFRLLMPGIGISSSISILIFNYYKVIKKTSLYLIYSITILILSIISNLIVYYFTKEAYAIAVTSLFILICWFFLLNYYLIKNYKIEWRKNTAYLIIMVVIFEIVTIISNFNLSLFLYITLYVTISYVFYKNRITNLFCYISNRK